MSDDQTAPRPPPIGLLALLILGIALYAATIGNIADLGSSDAAGRALGEAFGVIFGFCLWVLLAVMIVVAAVTGNMPVWARIAAGILVPALIPPLIAAYALWARLPQLHRVLPPVLTGIAVWGGVLALTLAPMPDYIGQKTPPHGCERQRNSNTKQRRRSRNSGGATISRAFNS